MLNPYIDYPENPLEICYQRRFEREDECKKYGFIALDCERKLQDEFYECIYEVCYK